MRARMSMTSHVVIRRGTVVVTRLYSLRNNVCSRYRLRGSELVLAHALGPSFPYFSAFDLLGAGYLQFHS